MSAEGLLGIGAAPGDGEWGGAARGQLVGERVNPRRRGRGDGFEQDVNDAVATEADAPDEVVFGGSVVGDEFGLAAGGDGARAQEDVFFEATAADGAEPLAGRGDEKSRAGAAVRRTGYGDEGGEYGGSSLGVCEVAEEGGQLSHGEVARMREWKGSTAIIPS